MARTKFAARKSTGGYAPRQEFRESWDQVTGVVRNRNVIPGRNEYPADLSDFAIDLNAQQLLSGGSASSAATRLPFVQMEEEGDITPDLLKKFKNSVEDMPIFDISNISSRPTRSVAGGPMRDYVVSREPIILEGDDDEAGEPSLDKSLKRLVHHILDRASNQWKRSNWVSVWKNHDGEFTVLPQEACGPDEYSEVEEILETGQLNGCDLRGNPSTGQFGLVSNRPLPENTVVAAECGILWSEDLHDDFIKRAGDDHLGLTSNLIPAIFLKKLATSGEWKKYKKACGQGVPIDETPGLVIESSMMGNETKHIDDNTWLFMMDSDVVGDNIPRPNLTSYLVLDLKRKVPTVLFETTQAVPEKKELTMDWGCWTNICTSMLPGQAQLSRVLHRHMKLLMAKAAEHGVRTDGIPDDLESNNGQLLFFNPKESIVQMLKSHLPQHGSFGNCLSHKSLGKEFELLKAIMQSCASDHIADEGDNDSWCHPDNDAVDLNYPGVYHSIRSDNHDRLSQTNRHKMNAVPREAYTAFDRAKARLETNYASRHVEVVQITDPQNPAKLFALPGTPVHGVIAKRNFRKNSPVISYGGTIEQLDRKASGNAYFVDAQMPEEYKGSPLFLDGRRSIGGMMNDPWSPPGFPKRDANLYSIEHWDIETNTPQVVFYALRHIKKGEELLWHYGGDYWRVALLSLIHEHVEYATKLAVRCKSLAERIADKLDTSAEDVTFDIYAKEDGLICV